MSLVVKTLLQPTFQAHHTSPSDFVTDNDAQAKNTQRVFAALEVLQIFGLPLESRETFIELIWYHVISPFWPIREKAAACFCSILTSEELLSQETRLLQSQWTSHNELHGRLLCLRMLDEARDSTDGNGGEPSGPGLDLLAAVEQAAQSLDGPTAILREKEARWLRWLVIASSSFDVSVLLAGGYMIGFDF